MATPASPTARTASGGLDDGCVEVEYGGDAGEQEHAGDEQEGGRPGHLLEQASGAQEEHVGVGGEPSEEQTADEHEGGPDLLRGMAEHEASVPAGSVAVGAQVRSPASGSVIRPSLAGGVGGHGRDGGGPLGGFEAAFPWPPYAQVLGGDVGAEDDHGGR